MGVWCVVGGGGGKRGKELPDLASRVLLPSCTRRPRVFGAEAWRRDHGFYTFIGSWHDLTVASFPLTGAEVNVLRSYHRSGGRKFPRVSPRIFRHVSKHPTPLLQALVPGSSPEEGIQCLSFIRCGGVP